MNATLYKKKVKYASDCNHTDFVCSLHFGLALNVIMLDDFGNVIGNILPRLLKDFVEEFKLHLLV